MPLPPNGVIYVQNGVCGTSYDLTQDYNDPAGCADLWLKGNYSQSLTIASENDIIVKNNITNGGGARADPQQLRAHLPPGHEPATATPAPTPRHADERHDRRRDPQPLHHSFIVDNYYCGAALGTLTVNGAIAQKFRGPGRHRAARRSRPAT